MTDARADSIIPLLDDVDNNLNNNADNIVSNLELNLDVIKLISLKLPYVKDLYHFRLTSKQINELIEGTPAGMIAREVTQLYAYSMNISIAETQLIKANSALENYANHCDADCRTAYANNCARRCPDCQCCYCCSAYCCNKNNWIGIACGSIATGCFVTFSPWGISSYSTYIIGSIVTAGTYLVVTGAGYLADIGLFNRREKIQYNNRARVSELIPKLENPIDDDVYAAIISNKKL